VRLHEVYDMSVKRRCDGTLIRDLPAFRVINPFVMRGRNESAVYLSQEIALTKTLEYIRKFNRAQDRDAPKLSLFHVLLCAAVRGLALRPQLNRFVSGQRIYQRNRIQISFIVKKQLTEEGAEANAKISFSPYETLSSIISKINSNVKDARDVSGTDSDKEIEFFVRFPRFVLNLFVRAFKFLDSFGIAPRSMIESDPLYTSVYLANLGSVGLDAPFHHLYEWGNASIFVAIGKLRKEPRLNRDGSMTVIDVIRVNYTIDDRISEGIYCAKGIELFKNFIENPEVLAERPTIPPEVLAEHGLVKTV
jgi:hypothetical protein